MELPVDTLLDADALKTWRSGLDDWLREQQTALRTLSDRWSPTVKLLVALQNRFWPAVSGRVVLTWDVDAKTRVDPTVGYRATFDPLSILAEHRASEEQLAGLYDWLSMRGARIEGGFGGPRTIGGDRWARLRLLSDRRVRHRLVGPARQAMDFYEAAEMIGRWWFMLTGRYLPAVDVAPQRRTTVPIDRETQVKSTHSRSPAALRDALKTHGLWPGRVHVVVEGPTEVDWVNGLVTSALGWLPDGLLITNLRGVGDAKRMESIVETIADYATASALILDVEGDMAKYTQRLVAAGLVDPLDVLLVDTSFEERNFSDGELIAAARYVATHPPGNRPRTTLRLTAKELRHAYQADVAKGRRGEVPGLANTLLRLCRDPEHGPVNISKIELNDELRRRTLERLDSQKAREREHGRPIVKFVFSRIVGPLADAAWR